MLRKNEAQDFIGLGTPIQDQAVDSSTSGFTAVNGRVTPPEDIKMNNPPLGGAHSASGTHAETYTREEWHRSHPNGDMVQRFTPPDGRAVRQTDSPGKRKRVVPDMSSSSSGGQTPSPNSERQRTGSYMSTTDFRASPEQGMPRFHNSQPPYSSPNIDGKQQGWYNRSGDTNPNSDRQLAEALQRQSEPMDIQQASSGGEGVSQYQATSSQQNVSSTTETTAAGVQVDPKKRKRVFSNRTKTGCTTCRKRKKKCDEGKPECNNCMRGGFVCEGYMSKATWTKPSMQQKMPPVPLQPSESGGLYPKSQRAQHVESNTPQPTEGARTQPIVVDEDQERPSKRAAWHHASWADSPQRSHAADRSMSTEYPHGLPLPEYSRQSQEIPDRPGAIVPIYRPPPQTATHKPATSSLNNSPAVTAQLALQHGVRPSPTHYPASEKEKMLNGDLYLPFSSQLVEEREQCKAALWRFNNAHNPGLGVSREERARLFRLVVEPAASLARPTCAATNPIGSLGKGVCVEAPFTCLYGYNINISDDVVIGSSCTILDPCKVVIGARTIIGPNVSIYGNTIPTDPRCRNGSQGPATGRAVYIDEDVFIGGGVTILPGIRIGKGSTVGAGSVVTRDVPRFTVVHGNPAKVRRGIWLDAHN